MHSCTKIQKTFVSNRIPEVIFTNLTITASRPGRLSSFLRGELAMSSGLVNRLKWGDAIRVNGTPRHTDYPVQPGDILTVRLDEETPEYPAEDGPLTILYEDDYLLAVDKPAGMLIHPSHSCNSGTLANLVAGYYQRNQIPAAFHPLTRLDRDTFGIVLLAKNSHIHALLQSGDAQKTYHALTYGWSLPDRGMIEAPIARRPLPSLLREIRADGKPSTTRYKVLWREEKICKLALQPVTGRTHQLRLHCAHVGHPILGDPQYGSPESTDFSHTLHLTAQALCAYSITLHHPLTGEEITIFSRMDV